MTVYDLISERFEGSKSAGRRQTLNRTAAKLYPQLPENGDGFVEECDGLIGTDEWISYQIVTLWIKRRKAYDLKYADTYESWLVDHTTHWGACDILCYRVLNPMIERFPSLYEEKVLKWAESDKIYVKRASAVCLLESTRSFRVNLPFEKVEKIADILLSDDHIHVQKGVGWLLKYAYLSYPEETVNYLKKNVKRMSRTTYRYGLEKMNGGLRAEMMEHG